MYFQKTETENWCIENAIKYYASTYDRSDAVNALKLDLKKIIGGLDDDGKLASKNA